MGGHRALLGDPAEQSQSVHVEVHHDGSTALAASTAYWARQVEHTDGHPIDVGVVEHFVGDAVALIVATGMHLGTTDQTLVKVDLVRNDGLPLAAVDSKTIGGLTLGTLEQPPWSRSVRRFLPVLTEVTTDIDTARGPLQSTWLTTSSISSELTP